jgi:hypothetical protein
MKLRSEHLNIGIYLKFGAYNLEFFRVFVFHHCSNRDSLSPAAGLGTGAGGRGLEGVRRYPAIKAFISA